MWTLFKLQPVFIDTMMHAIYGPICKHANLFGGKKSMNVSNVKVLSKFFSTFMASLCLFGENDSLHFRY